MKRQYAMTIFMIGAGSFGFNPLFVKLGYAAGWTLGEINGAQILIALAALWLIGIFAMIRNKSAVCKLNVKNILAMMAAGSLTGLTSIFYYGAMRYLPASMAIIFLFQFVWIGVLYEWIFDRRRPNRQTVLSVILTLVGVFFAAGILGGKIYQFSMIGLVLGIASAFSYSAFILTSGRVSVEVPATIRTPIMITGAGILTCAVFPPTFLADTSVAASNLWMYAAGVSLCGVILPPFLFALSAPHLPASLATILGAVELPVAVIVAALGLGEHVSGWQWLGIILILLSIVIGEIKAVRISGLFQRGRKPTH